VIVESIPFEVVQEEKAGIDYMSIIKTILKYIIPLYYNCTSNHFCGEAYNRIA